MVELKNCPFCGSDDVGPEILAVIDDEKLTAIACADCGANGPVVTAADSTDETLAAGWNRRDGEAL